MGRWTLLLCSVVCAAACSARGSGTGGTGGTGGAPVDTADAAVDTGPPPDDTGFSGPFWSATTLGIPGNTLLIAGGPTLNTYRTYVRTQASGARLWSIWLSNATDSTFGPGAPHPNQPGGAWRIVSATLADGGAAHDGTLVAGTQVPVTFAGGQATKDVAPGERFWSDPVNLDLPDGHYLAFTWAVSIDAAGTFLPYTSAPFVTSYRALGADRSTQESAMGFTASTDPLVGPQLYAYDRPITKRLCFLGDSITQGIGATRDGYHFWVARIADALGPDVGVWNLGSGWARAADAASDGYWLWKAKRCDEVAVILGVNDIINSSRDAPTILADLTTIVALLKQNRPDSKVLMFTVPTFNLGGTAYATWKQVNDAIRAAPPAGTDRVFDVASALSQPAPNDGMLKPGYTNGDGHPNDTGSAAIADAFLAWYPTP